MELSYKALEAALVAHFHIHPDKTGTFRSRIKQLQRLRPEGFPPGVNVGRGEKMDYSAAHLFQLVTAFELIGAGMTADRAAKIVTANWRAFSTAYSFAVYGLRKLRPERVFCWVLSRSFSELQSDPYPAKMSLSTFAHNSRVAVGDEDGLGHQLLSKNARRTAHCYAIIPVSDLTASVLKAVEGAGGFVRARLDPEFMNWLPPEDVERAGWLFVESINPWEPAPEAYNPADEHSSTQEVDEQIRTREAVRRALVIYETQRQHRGSRTISEDEITDRMKLVACGVADQLSPHALKMMEVLISEEEVEPTKDAIKELYEWSLIRPGTDEIIVMPLGWAVAHEAVKRSAAVSVTEKKSSNVTELRPPAPKRRRK